ncbi:MAG: protease HtpX [Bdellovibrio sp. CG10_big_fil_rev_8_21_14_0_10_47_8]|nr:MAG: protease HtpX [Bdellovibrio sp. CG10_big_fil_rev_8_21_14_0_10_47_8]
MTWFKRIGLFVAVNALVIGTISILLNVLGVKPYIMAYGLDYQSLMIFCLIWGMGGAFISLALSRVMAKWMMGVQIVPANTPDPELRELVQMVHQLSRAARLPAMPQVGVYESQEVNAFATGPSKSRSLVAVSSGLLLRMKNEEIRGVIGHEVAHIANGDMVTMTLVQGVVNAFVMFLARAIAYALTMAKGQGGEERGTPLSYYAVQFALEIAFMILGSMVVAWFSRRREYRADSGGARLAGRDNMIQALEGLKRTFDNVDPSAQPALQALKISSRSGGFMKFFSTHPPLEERIRRLRGARA